MHRRHFESLQHVSRVIGDWIGFYNHQRPHQGLKMKTPAQAYGLAASPVQELLGQYTTLLNPKGEIIMANIGTFTAEKDGSTGTLRTLTLNAKIKLLPDDKGDNESAPDYRLQVGGHGIGAVWKMTSEAGRSYMSVTLDDPSFPAAVYVRLIEGEDSTHNLIWSRSKPGSS